MTVKELKREKNDIEVLISFLVWKKAKASVCGSESEKDNGRVDNEKIVK